MRFVCFDGLPGIQQDTFCDLTKNDQEIIIESKKGSATVRLNISQLDSIDTLDEKNFYMQYLAVEKKPVKVMPKTFYIFKYTSSDETKKHFTLYSYEFKALSFIENIREVTMNGKNKEISL